MVGLRQAIGNDYIAETWMISLRDAIVHHQIWRQPIVVLSMEGALSRKVLEHSHKYKNYSYEENKLQCLKKWVTMLEKIYSARKNIIWSEEKKEVMVLGKHFTVIGKIKTT